MATLYGFSSNSSESSGEALEILFALASMKQEQRAMINRVEIFDERGRWYRRLGSDDPRASIGPRMGTKDVFKYLGGTIAAIMRNMYENETVYERLAKDGEIIAFNADLANARPGVERLAMDPRTWYERLPYIQGTLYRWPVIRSLLHSTIDDGNVN